MTAMQLPLVSALHVKTTLQYSQALELIDILTLINERDAYTRHFHSQEK